MIEAVYLLDDIPDIYLFTVSIKELMPMTLELSEPVEACISQLIEKILDLAKELHLKKV